MKTILKKLRFLSGNILGYLIYKLSGKNALLKNINKHKVLSIYFHNPSVYVFNTVISWLLDHNYTLISLEELKDSFEQGGCSNERSVFISFDDAWSNNLKLIPIIEKFNLPITLFVSTKAIEDGAIWLNIVRKQFTSIDQKLKEGISISDLKKIPHDFGLKLYYSAKKAGIIEREIMTKQELIKFSEFASIGSHTVTHPILTNCSLKTIKFEIDQSFETLNEWQLGICESFAYPNGSFNKKIIDILKQSKYKYAFTTEPRFIDLLAKENNYTIPRICIPDGFGKYENLARMSSVWSKFFNRWR
mgnify:CR=1 FL=1